MNNEKIEPKEKPQEPPRMCSVCNQARAIDEKIHFASGIMMNKCVPCQTMMSLIGIRMGIDEIVEELRELNGSEY